MAPGTFTAVYEAEIHYVCRTLRRLGAAAADVEDLAHDVFVVAFRRRDERDPAASMRAWLFGIAYRLVANYRKKAHRNREISPESGEHRSPGRTPETIAGDRELLLVAMNVLELGHRATLVLHDIEGMTGPQIADLLEIPTNTVYSRVRNARARLLARICEMQGEPQ